MTAKLSALALLALLPAAAACRREPTPSPAAAPTAEAAAEHVTAVEEWRARRDARLRSEDGWLSLVGLLWLKEGENSFGSDAANDLVFPPNAPARAGTLALAGGKVTLRAEPGAGLTDADGKPLTTLELKSDGEGEPTLVKLGTLSFFVIERGDRLGLRLKDSQSAVRTGFTGIESFPIAARWRVEGRLEPYTPPKIIPVPNILGSVDDSTSPGAIVFAVDGKEVRLDPILEEGSEDLFVIFGDETNGHETYGGGRFLYTQPPGPDGKVVLDFNQSYNPPCVFTPFATCPLPPAQNKLPFRIEAGEKMYGAQHAAPAAAAAEGAAAAPAPAPGN